MVKTAISFLVMMAGVAAGAATNEVDVYAIGDPVAALAALRAKWPEAGERVSVWKMPALQEQFDAIYQCQVWADEDHAARYDVFERASRDAVELKIEPALWYYNLACAQAVLGKTEEAFASLEQAVAAGYGVGDAAHAREDADLASLTNDVRFARLCAMMEADKRPYWGEPEEPARDEGGVVRLSERNVYYEFRRDGFWCELQTTNACPIVYVNHHVDHPVVPCEGLIAVAYPAEAREEGVAVGAANLDVVMAKGCSRGANTTGVGGVREGANTTGEDEELTHLTTIVASDWTEGDPMREPVSIPGKMAMRSDMQRDAYGHAFYWNVIAIYAVGADYGYDGADRFFGWCPYVIAHAGGAEESDKFVRLAAEIVRALPTNILERAATVVPWVIRHSQRCVTDDASFMAGAAQRPVLRFDDIDPERVRSVVRKLRETEVPPPLQPFFDLDSVECSKDYENVTDLWDDPYTLRFEGVSFHQVGLLARNGDWTCDATLTIARRDNEKFVWKVLQGDKRKVRITSVGKDRFRLEVDYHEAFDVPWTDGTTNRSSRVDLGCFAVCTNGVSSPSVVSVNFMPNETRTYDADHRLVSIDYTQRQYLAWCPKLFPMGDWKDVFRRDAAGRLTGWTRYAPGGPAGGVQTNEFTREGLEILTRDDLGRPKDVLRNLRSTWIQAMNPTNLAEEISGRGLAYAGRYRDEAGHRMYAESLNWGYVYSNDEDRVGKPLPRKPTLYACRPELCRRADFADPAAGFRLPFMDQLAFGYAIYSAYKHDIVGTDVLGMLRSDSPENLKTQGFTPPKVLKKMRFCPFAPSTNDLWTVGTGDFLKTLDPGECVWEESDGVFRVCEGGTEEYWERTLPVYMSERYLNAKAEVCAYAELDRSYRRCTHEEVKRLLSDRLEEKYWSRVLVVEGAPARGDRVPRDVSMTAAMWKIGDDLAFGILGLMDTPGNRRAYVFRELNPKTGHPRTWDDFRGLPDRAIGNTMLRCRAGDPAALNNFAVLFYADIANPGHYDEESVIMLLERAAKAGNATALWNLGVLYENRGESYEAARYYEEARAKREGVSK